MCTRRIITHYLHITRGRMHSISLARGNGSVSHHRARYPDDFCTCFLSTPRFLKMASNGFEKQRERSRLRYIFASIRAAFVLSLLYFMNRVRQRGIKSFEVLRYRLQGRGRRWPPDGTPSIEPHFLHTRGERHLGTRLREDRLQEDSFQEHHSQIFRLFAIDVA